MPHKLSFRQGWQSQNLARFLLYKFSFVAEPVYTADDIGGDFFCTLFETQRTSSNTDLLPKNSFWIQVKSSNESQQVELTTIKPMLLNLEMPFFVGIVDRDGLKVTIFSGHYLTPLLCYKDPITIERLSAKLCEATSITGLHDDYFEETSPGIFTLYFPKVAEVSAQTNDHDLKEAVKKVQGSCSLMLENIAARISNEYTFKTHDAQSLLFFSGPTSLRFFQDNFFDRLTEGFFNIHNAYSLEQNRSQAANLFDLYEKIYLDLTSYYGEDNLPAPLKRTYQGAKNRIKEQDEGSRIA